MKSVDAPAVAFDAVSVDGTATVDDFGGDDFGGDDFVDGDAPGDALDEGAPGRAVPTQAAPAEADLTERERQILAFERKWWKHAGAKEQAIRDTFKLSATRYYQILNGLLDNPAALAHSPVVVGRLRRLRSTRVRSRGGAGRVV